MKNLLDGIPEGR